jgi:excinuclease ABC subunit C
MKDFKRVMIELAQDMHLKKLKIKEKIEVLENYQSRSTIVNQKSPILMFSQLFLMKVPHM